MMAYGSSVTAKNADIKLNNGVSYGAYHSVKNTDSESLPNNVPSISRKFGDQVVSKKM